jgi:anti-anti-sigma regulatory factor
MHTHQFRRKIKLPSTVAIKHEILKMMLQDHLKAQILDTTAIEVLDAEGLGVAKEAERLRKSAPTPVLSA